MLSVILWGETNENEEKPITFGHYLKGLTIKIVESKFVLVLYIHVIFNKTTSQKIIPMASARNQSPHQTSLLSYIYTFTSFSVWTAPQMQP